MTPNRTIRIQGARVHNLKNVSVEIPRNRLVVVTGVSGSGKSSLVFDTLYAEGHRKYVESLSSYARQFLSRINKPDVDYITGLSPAIAIEQRTITSNPRSTVGSITEVFDYLRLLFARTGRTISPATGLEVTHDAVPDVVDAVLAGPADATVQILAPLPNLGRTLAEELNINLQKGFTRIFHNGEVLEIEDLLAQKTLPSIDKPVLLIDRFKLRLPTDPDELEDFRHRISDSIQTAYNEGAGFCRVRTEGHEREFSERYEQDGIKFEKPSVSLFNANNPFGACPVCEGFGRVMGIDEELVIPNKYESVADGCVRPWQSMSQETYQRDFLKRAAKLNFRADVPYIDLTPAEKRLLWRGTPDCPGIDAFFGEIEAQAHKVQYRVMLARYRGYTTCHACEGKKLRPEALYVKIHGFDFGDLQAMNIEELGRTFASIPFDDHERAIAKRILLEIESRLAYLLNVGVGYLALDRRANTLSGGETQRINLATSLGSTLTGALYILDEPSIGLHPHDNERLIAILERLRALGNSVIVVEHDEAIMRRADFLVDMGPRAGEHGGHVVHAGLPADVLNNPESLTAAYLTGRATVPLPEKRRAAKQFFEIRGAAEHNLRNIDAKFPHGCLTVVTGVSGSGKTTLIKGILYPALAANLELATQKPGVHRELVIPTAGYTHTEMVDQRAVGRNLRSNPVTYVGAYDYIRDLYAAQPTAQASRLKPAHFSFNVEGGRCDTCQGEGHVTIPMQFLPDVKLPCETCGGKRFKQMVLEVQIKGKHISDVLEMTVTEALEFFKGQDKITQRLDQLVNVGLGYVRLGQSTGQLSGGEAQRLKLASFLQRKQTEHTVYIFDEPTTGLHFEDIRVLMIALQALVDQGNTVIIVEHNLEVIKCADWIVDLGPGGGTRGGRMVYQGPPAGLPAVTESLTARYVGEKL